MSSDANNYFNFQSFRGLTGKVQNLLGLNHPSQPTPQPYSQPSSQQLYTDPASDFFNFASNKPKATTSNPENFFGFVEPPSNGNRQDLYNPNYTPPPPLQMPGLKNFFGSIFEDAASSKVVTTSSQIKAPQILSPELVTSQGIVPVFHPINSPQQTKPQAVKKPGEFGVPRKQRPAPGHTKAEADDDLLQLLQTSQVLKELDAKGSLGEIFSDKSFPANSQSIIGSGRDPSLAQKTKDYVWLRPTAMKLPDGWGRPVLFTNMKQEDIVQGELGDCYLISAIVAIAQHPQRIQRNFLTKSFTGRGAFGVALCIGGIWRVIEIDDQFPCNKGTGVQVFSRCTSGELWVSVLEKAWAKVHGGYGNIKSGTPQEAMRDLTGAPTEMIILAQDTSAWQRLLAAKLNNHLITAGSDEIRDIYNPQMSVIGLHGSHAYTVIDVTGIGPEPRLLSAEECLAAGDSPSFQRLVKLRNPWGKDDVQSEWGFDSPRWPKQLRARLAELRKPGEFFMGFEQFARHFRDIAICHFEDTYRYSAIKLRAAREQFILVDTEVSVEGKYFLSLNQPNQRLYAPSANYQYSPIVMLVARIDPYGNPLYLKGCMRPDKENWIDLHLSPGRYAILIRPLWKGAPQSFSFSTYGPAKCILRLDPRPVELAFLERLFLRHAESPDTGKAKTFDGIDCFYKSFDTDAAFGYIFLKHPGPRGIATIKVDISGSKNIQLLDPALVANPTVSLRPNQYRLFLYSASQLPYVIDYQLSLAFKGPNKNSSNEFPKVTKNQRKLDNGEPIDIFIEQIQTEDDVTYKIQNFTKDIDTYERFDFKLENARIEGKNTNFVEIQVKPNSEAVIRIVKIDPDDNFNVRMMNKSRMVQTIKRF